MYAYKGTFSAATSTGNQTITGIVDENGNSFTPKALIVWSSFGTSAAFIDGWTFHIAVADGTTSRTTCTAASDNVAAQRSYSDNSSGLISVINAANTTLRAGTLSSFGSGQFVINWSTVTASAEVFHYIALGGADLATNVAAPNIGAESRSPITLANLIGAIALSARDAASATGTGIGWFASGSGGTVNQGVATPFIRDNVNPSQCYRYERTDQYKAIFNSSAAGTINTAGGRDSIGDIFSTNAQNSLNFNPLIGLAGISMAAGSGLQPTSTGTQSINGLGFSPKAVLIASVGAAASSSPASEARISLGGADRSRQGHAIAGSNNGVTPSVCVSYQDTSKIVSAITPSATAASTTTEAQASLQSIDSDGFTLNWTTADATQREYIWLALGDAPAASGGEKSTTFVGFI